MTNIFLQYIPYGRGNMPGWMWITLMVVAVAVWLFEKWYWSRPHDDED